MSFVCLYRNHQRCKRQERQTLVQGIDLPTPAPVTGTALPPAQQRIARRPRVQATEHAYALPPDTSGEVTGRRRRQTAGAAASDAPATTAAPTVGAAAAEHRDASMSNRPVPRTTAWRHQRRLQEAAAQGQGPPPPKKERKQYSCRVCGATDHQQYYGQRYCPSATNLSYDDWLREAKAARAAKRASQTSSQAE